MLQFVNIWCRFRTLLNCEMCEISGGDRLRIFTFSTRKGYGSVALAVAGNLENPRGTKRGAWQLEPGSCMLWKEVRYRRQTLTPTGAHLKTYKEEWIRKEER